MLVATRWSNRVGNDTSHTFEVTAKHNRAFRTPIVTDSTCRFVHRAGRGESEQLRSSPLACGPPELRRKRSFARVVPLPRRLVGIRYLGLSAT